MLTSLLSDLRDRLCVCREARRIERAGFHDAGRMDTLKFQAVWILSLLRRYGR